MKHLTPFFITAALLLMSCNNSSSTDAAKEQQVQEDTAVQKTDSPKADNSQNSLDWAGTYKGVVPCADCEGIETTLNITKELNYTLSTKYLGKKDSKVYDSKGKFKWDDAGSIITLDSLTSAPNQYKVGENVLLQLDMQGNIITGDNAAKYQLKKQ